MAFLRMLSETFTGSSPGVMSTIYFPIRLSGGFLVSLVLLLFCIFLMRRRNTSSSPLPPSPPAEPFIGHARKLPQTHSWKTYATWGRSYGDVVYASALGHSMLIINSVEAARDLLEKRGTTFSDRPYSPVLDLYARFRIFK
ncbi:hypothetical protein M0805_007917 [Coniferiporia weirii]|nr:hypothetical protein M0805_007917 [Coniferiporia weirii]